MARPWSARCYGVARQRDGSRQNSIGGRWGAAKFAASIRSQVPVSNVIGKNSLAARSCHRAKSPRRQTVSGRARGRIRHRGWSVPRRSMASRRRSRRCRDNRRGSRRGLSRSRSSLWDPTCPGSRRNSSVAARSATKPAEAPVGESDAAGFHELSRGGFVRILGHLLLLECGSPQDVAG